MFLSWILLAGGVRRADSLSVVVSPLLDLRGGLDRGAAGAAEGAEGVAGEAALLMTQVQCSAFAQRRKQQQQQHTKKKTPPLMSTLIDTRRCLRQCQEGIPVQQSSP